MQLSKRTQYGLRAMICLADAYSHGYLQTRELVAREKLPNKFLESILASLTRGKFLVSKIGSVGGYRLASDPREILVGDIITRLEGKKLFAEPTPVEGPLPPGEIGVRLVQDQLTAAVRDVMGKMTLAELSEKVAARGRGHMFYI